MLDKADLGVEDKMEPGTNRVHPARHDRRGYCGKCRVVREVQPADGAVLTCLDCGSPLERTEGSTTGR